MRRQREFSMSHRFHHYLRVLGLSGCVALLSAAVNAQTTENPDKRTIISFDRPIIGPYGVSDRNPMDPDQGIKMSLVEDGLPGKTGRKVLKLEYDVDSHEPAKAEFWLRLREMDLSRFDTLHLYLRGNTEHGKIRGVTIRIVDAGHRTAPYILTGIENHWKEFSIPLKRFSRIRDWSKIDEFGIVFDDVYSVPKEGALFVDKIDASSNEKR